MHTIVLSDLHLTDAEPPGPHPLWKAYKRTEHFIDADCERLLVALQAQIDDRIELVLNGDVFDFDSVMTLPVGEVSFLERHRGLSSEEHKSCFKMQAIVHDHPVFFGALSDFLARGHRVVLVTGNHDLELCWPGVRKVLRQRLAGDLVFADWFYVSGGDTLIEHGHQHDPFCATPDPLHPWVKAKAGRRVRIPFGNLAERYMLNGMGLMNPHVDASFIKDSVWGYLRFFMYEVLHVQPLLLWTWLWGAIVTLAHAYAEGMLPIDRPAVGVHERLTAAARAANAELSTTSAMREHHAHPVTFDPWLMAQELWIDRVLVAAASAFGAFEAFVLLRLAMDASLLWLVPLGACAALITVSYASTVRSRVSQALDRSRHAGAAAAALCGLRRVVHGHTHVVAHEWIDGVEYLNPGTWSPAFVDAACTQLAGERCIVWLKPTLGGRQASLHVYPDLLPRLQRLPSRLAVAPVNAECAT